MEKLDRDILSEYEYVEANIEEITTKRNERNYRQSI